MKSKLSIEELKVTSFVTSIKSESKNSIIGGGSETVVRTLESDCGCQEPTGLGASCEWTQCETHKCPVIAGA